MISDIKQLSTEKKQHLLAVGVGTVVVLVAIYFALIRPAQASRAKLQASITEAEKKASDALKLVKSTEAEEEKLNRREEQLAATEATMVTGDPNLWIRQTYEKFRTQSPYKVEIPNFPPPALGDMVMIPEFPYKAATYRVRGSAYYHDLGKFLAEFENYFPYMRLMNLDLSPDEAGTTAAGEEREKLLFSFEIAALVKPPKKS
ncbi:MAG: hypothetical protein RL514_1899 [Verrucomicrobiota bacterium]|jgi:hypothetical protein